jgi:NAD(P)-dependent dehydrogenase (short-subunit alcohol dehydrogenase family)
MEADLSRRKVALVTGGYKNIGEEISKQLVALGHTVVATYRSDDQKARRTSKELGIQVHKADMSDEEDVKHLFKVLHSEGMAVGYLVNNVSSFPQGPLLEMDPNEFRAAFESCVHSAFYCTNLAVKDMIGFGGGSIVNIGMAGAGKVKGYGNVAAHGAAKTALAVLTKSYALELETYKIKVNMVSPGIVDRPDRDEIWRERMRTITQAGSLVTEEDVATAVVGLLLKSDLTGSILDIQ